MDIQQWLQNTADREPPDPSDNVASPEKFRNDRPEGERAGRSYRYKRKRASSDISLIGLRRDHRPDSKSPACTPFSGRARRSQDGARNSKDRESAITSHASIPHAPNQTYEKRARHKTRIDRYEPKTKRQRRERATRKDEKSNRRRRKPRRKDDGGRTTGLIQTFQLKNRPKSNRLTLKPDTSAGLFKHGRASVQVTGKGAGLPDLVFNEMRFLQRSTEHQDEAARQNDAHTLRDKDPKPDQREQISAYFNAKTAIGGGQHGKHDDRGQQARSKGLLYQIEPSKEADPARSLVELPEKPFLGFESRGARQESNTRPIDDNGYYTWSESMQQPPTPHLGQAHEARNGNVSQVEPSPQSRRLRKSYNHHRGPATKTNYEPTTEPKNRNIDHAAWTRTERGDGAAHVEVYRPPNTALQHKSHRTPAPQTTSQSLPRCPSSPPRFFKSSGNGIMGGLKQRHDYHTSDILRIRDESAKADDAQARTHTPYGDHDKENQDPASSLSIDKAIRQADVAAAAVAAQHSFAPFPGQAPEPDIENLPDIRKMSSINDLPRIRQVGRAGQRRLYETPSERPKSSVPIHPQWPLLNSQFKISNAERQQWETAANATLASRAQEAIYHRPIYLEDEDARFDKVANTNYASNLNDDTLETYWHRSSSVVDRGSSVYETQMQSARHHPTTPAFSRVESTRSGPGRVLSVENHMYGDRPDAQQVVPIDDPIEDDLAGFWKPNVLY